MINRKKKNLKNLRQSPCRYGVDRKKSEKGVRVLERSIYCFYFEELCRLKRKPGPHEKLQEANTKTMAFSNFFHAQFFPSYLHLVISGAACSSENPSQMPASGKQWLDKVSLYLGVFGFGVSFYFQWIVFSFRYHNLPQMIC